MYSCSGVDTSDKPRVILLGGGLAGLRCAQQLVTEHGFSTENIVLLEASTRIGGRIRTDKSFIEGFSVSGPLHVHMHTCRQSRRESTDDDASPSSVFMYSPST